MTLVTGGRSKERILLYGMEGVGKSLAALDIAARVAPNRVFIIDNDNAWDRMLEGPTLDGAEVKVQAEYRWDQKLNGGRGDFTFDDKWCVEDGNVWVYHVQGWTANIAALASVVEEAAPDDWCCIDSGSALWDDVSDWYVDKVFGKSKADFFLQARLAMEKDEFGGLDGWKDYSVINAEYREHAMQFLITPPCHLLVTCEEAQLSSGQIKGKDIEDREAKALYGGVAYKPRGQKRIGHNMQTVVRLERKANGDYAARTVKDRGGRERYAGESVKDRGFCEWYLEEVGGWQEQTTHSGEGSTPATPPSTTSSIKAKGSPSAPAKKLAAKA